jgi:hypothetical protein
MNRASLLSVLLVIALSGCKAVEGDFPSLAKRPFESTNPNAPPLVVPETPIAESLPADMALVVANLVQRHQKAQDQYVGMLAAVQGQAARAAGSAMGSEAWINAHLAVSRLDSARADSVAALAEMDALIEKQIEREESDNSPRLIALLEPKQRLLIAAVAEQSSELDRLAKQIGL